MNCESERPLIDRAIDANFTTWFMNHHPVMTPLRERLMQSLSSGKTFDHLRREFGALALIEVLTHVYVPRSFISSGDDLPGMIHDDCYVEDD